MCDNALTSPYIEQTSPPTEEFQEEIPYYTLPKSHKINAKAIHYGTGASQRQKKLERDKKKSKLGIITIEKAMRDNSTEGAKTIQDLEHCYQHATPKP